MRRSIGSRNAFDHSALLSNGDAYCNRMCTQNSNLNGLVNALGDVRGAQRNASKVCETLINIWRRLLFLHVRSARFVSGNG